MTTSAACRVPRSVRLAGARVLGAGYYPERLVMETMRAMRPASIQHSADKRLHASSGRCGWSSSPATELRNRFDSYGVNINNASIASSRVPSRTVEQRGHDRRYLRSGSRRRCSSAPMHRSPGARDERLRELRLATAGGEGAPDGAGLRSTARPGLQGSPSRVEARSEPGARGTDQAETDPHLVGRRRREVQLPAHGRPGVGPRGARGDRLDWRAAPARPRARHPLHQRERLGRPATRLARGCHLPHRQEAPPLALR